MAIIEIPVRSDIAAYQFKQEIEAVIYNFNFRWNERMSRWFFSIGDEEDVELLSGIPVHTNVDLKGRFRQEKLPRGRFLCYDETGKGRDPDRSNFGTEIKFLYEEFNV